MGDKREGEREKGERERRKREIRTLREETPVGLRLFRLLKFLDVSSQKAMTMSPHDKTLT